MESLNTTHTVRIIQDNRGVKFLLGAVAIFLLVRWWLTGSLLHVFEAVRYVDPETDVANAAGSIADTLVPIGLDMVIAIGGIMLGLGTGIWQIAWDSIRAGLKYLHANQTATAIGMASGVNAATVAATTAATKVEPSRVDPAKLKAVLTQLDDRVKALESKLLTEPNPAPPAESQADPSANDDSPSRSVDRLAALESQMSKLLAAVTKKAAATPRAAKGAAK